jgi:hypothetical protein
MLRLHSSIRSVALFILAAFVLPAADLVEQSVNRTMRPFRFVCMFAILLSAMALAQSNPVPLVNQPLVPTSVVPGSSGLTLTMNGTGFVSTSIVNWDGRPLSTTFVSSHQLVADVPSSDLASANTASVTVSSPAPGGGTSNAVPFTITSPTSSLTFATSMFPVGFAPAGIVVADFNGDGKGDLAVLGGVGPICGGLSGSISILLGNGDGTFTTKSTLCSGNPFSGVVGDFNHDGKLDLAVVSTDGSFACGAPPNDCASLTMYLGNGDGTFTENESLPIDGDVLTVVAADFNRDGDLDLAVSYDVDGFSDVAVLLGNGDGTFQADGLYNLLSENPLYDVSSLAVGDFNNDGIIDLALVGGGGQTTGGVELGPLSIFLGNGDGTFTAATSQPSVTLVDPVSMTAGDFNGDGNLDLAISDAGSNALTVLHGNGDGTFTQVSGEPALSQFSDFVTTTDLNGDGNLDLVFSNSCGTGCAANAISIFLGNGDGTFQAGLTETVGNAPSAGNFPSLYYGVAVGDFNGDGRFDLAVTNSSNNTVSILLRTRAQPSAAIASSSNLSAFEQPVTFTATVTSQGADTPTGTVTFTYGSTTLCNVVTLSGGTATCAYPALQVGSDVVIATYSGDSNFGASSASLSQTVSQASTTLTLLSSVDPSGLDQLVSFTAAITPQYGGQATGAVTFKDGSTTLGSAAVSGNVASLTTSGLAIGTHSITAVYSGDSNFTGSTSNMLSQVVTKATSTTTLVSSLNPSVQGKSVTFTATVSSLAGTPVGNIAYLNGTTVLATVTLTSGSAKYTTSKLPAGFNIITAVYLGDSNNSGSTSLAVNQFVLAATTTTLTSSPNPSAYGQSVVFSATVTSSIGALPNGETIIFTEGTTVLGTGTMSGGMATLATSTLGMCSNVVTAVYSGDASFAASTSKPVTQVVRKAASTTAVSSSLSPSIFGQSVTFTATVAPQFSGTPMGTVTFKNGTAMLGTVTLSGGVASYTTTKLAGGTASITAVYNGSTSLAPSTSTPLSQAVSQASTTITLSSSLNPSSFKEAVTFTATVAAQSGECTVTGTVTFYDGTTALKTVSLSGGVAKFTSSTLTSGTHLITTSYNGSTSFGTSSSAPLAQTVQ